MNKFQPVTFYKGNNRTYLLLPFRFSELDETRFVLSNLSGEYLVAEKSETRQFIRHQLSQESELYKRLRASHFLVDDKSTVAEELVAIKVRTKYARLSEFTSLHMFVVTLRCEHSCPYCQVSRQSDDRVAFDMSKETASKAINLMMQSPSEAIKVEFQGGEPLLNFDLIQFIVEETSRINQTCGKDLQFVIATNLALITVEILDYCAKHKIFISTSLDGPKSLHGKNRPRPGKDSYERTIAGIDQARRKLGRSSVSALMTTTADSLTQVREIIDEYLTHGFEGIFLRPLSPYGFALKTKQFEAYSTQKWLNFYKEGLDYILELNKTGINFSEYYASTILSKMLTSQDPGYVDLMSPSGIGIAAVVYNYDGDVYASDESRMLAEMGNTHFKIGNVHKDSYVEIFGNETLLNALEDSFAYSCPQCHDCAYEPYCGSDPVYHYGRTGDYIGRKPNSEHCARNMGIIKYLITKMNDDPSTRQIFLKWANRK